MILSTKFKLLTGTSDDFGMCSFPSNIRAHPNNTNTAQKSLSFYITIIIHTVQLRGNVASLATYTLAT